MSPAHSEVALCIWWSLFTRTLQHWFVVMWPKSSGWFCIKNLASLISFVEIRGSEVMSLLFLAHRHPCPHSHPDLHHPSVFSHSPPSTPRLRQPLQPHPPQPLGRVGGPAGPPAAGGAGQDDAYVSVEGGYCSGLARGCHGNAYVHPQLLGKCQER